MSEPSSFGGVWDAVVIGGGPAGSVAAYHLARGGARVAVLEKESLPRYKTCGGGVVYRARRMLPVAIDAAIERECHEASMSFRSSRASGLPVVVRREEPLVTMTMRSTLDHLLLDGAQQAGAELFAPRVAMSIVPTRSDVSVGTDRGDLRARFVVAADGVLSPTARMAGWQTPLAGIPGLEWELWTERGTFGRFESTAWFEIDPARNGYSWIFPKRDHLSVGTLSTRRGRSDLAGMLEHYLARCGVGIDRVERHGFTIPVAPRTGTFVRNRVILVGDAAGLADPVTCEGIGHAMLSARLAADSLLNAEFDEERVRFAYQEELRRRILGELFLARGLARVLYRPSILGRRLFARYGQELAEAMADVIAGRRTYRELLTRPSNYLRLLRDALGAAGVKLRGLMRT